MSPRGEGETSGAHAPFRPSLLLDEFDLRLDSCRDPDAVVAATLEASVALHRSQFGTLQLLEKKRKGLVIAAQQGFKREFLAAFDVVAADDDCACGRALRSPDAILIPDVDRDTLFAPYRDVAAEAGFRSVQSTPMAASDGRVVGVVSTHFAEPHRPSEANLMMTRLYTRAASNSLRRLAGENPALGAPSRIPVQTADRSVFLDLADTHIAEATSRIQAQQDTTRRLRDRNLPFHTAEGQLRMMLRSLETLLWHRRIVMRGAHNQ